MVKMIFDVGGSHCGHECRAIKAIKIASDAKAWGVKFQVFENDNKNMPFDLDWLHKCNDIANVLGINLGFSVFSEQLAEDLAKRVFDCDPDKKIFIKIALSKSKDWNFITKITNIFRYHTIFITAEYLDSKYWSNKNDKLKILKTYSSAGAAQYPCPDGGITFENHETIYSGISDHTYGCGLKNIINASNFFPKDFFVERHLGDYDQNILDSYFSVPTSKCKNFVETANKINSLYTK